MNEYELIYLEARRVFCRSDVTFSHIESSEFFSAQGCHNIIRHRLGEGDLGWLGGMVCRVIGVVTGIGRWDIGGWGMGGQGGRVRLLVVDSFLYASLPKFVQAECNYDDEDHE